MTYTGVILTYTEGVKNYKHTHNEPQFGLSIKRIFKQMFAIFQHIQAESSEQMSSQVFDRPPYLTKDPKQAANAVNKLLKSQE